MKHRQIKSLIERLRAAVVDRQSAAVSN